MSRYYRRFYNSDLMVQIDEETARRSGTYVEEIEDPVRVFRCFLAHKPSALVYQGWDDPAVPLADARNRNEGIPIEIYSSVERRSDGTQTWRTWYADPGGELQKILEPELNA